MKEWKAFLFEFQLENVSVFTVSQVLIINIFFLRKIIQLT